MKNRIWLYVVLIALLGGLVLWMAYFQNENTTRPQLYNFTVEDTSAVYRIVIKDKRPMETVLTRTADGWMVNGEHHVRPDAMEVLLETLKRQEMRSFAPEMAKERVMNQMSSRGVEVIVESNGESVKHFYVGGNAPDLLGTYMMIDGSDGPYLVHIPGFNGFLNTRYFADPALWRDRSIVGVSPERIESVSIQYHREPEMGFRVEQPEVGVVKVVTMPGEQAMSFDSTAALGYLQEFRRIYFEGLITEDDRIWEKKDSILNSEPVFTLRVDGEGGRDTELVAYYKSAPPGTTNSDGNPRAYDLDRFYALLNGKDFILIQNYALRKILRDRSYFEGSAVVKK
ncbi:MAG: DUF4340 domain-containing protein [Flavobacteriales bacterium]|nr:DUF4340 domain-containing protein [Flavobacteriales bacterium]